MLRPYCCIFIFGVKLFVFELLDPDGEDNASKGSRMVQADSGSDSDSESQIKNEEIIPVNRLTPTVWIAPPTKDILCTAWRQLSVSEWEPRICLHYTRTLSLHRATLQI